MPRNDGVPPGTLILLVLRVLAAQPLHGYALAQRLSVLSGAEREKYSRFSRAIHTVLDNA